MNLKSYIITFISCVFLGASWGYIIGYYFGAQSDGSNAEYYYSMPILAISSFLILYSVLYLNK